MKGKRHNFLTESTTLAYGTVPDGDGFLGQRAEVHALRLEVGNGQALHLEQRDGAPRAVLSRDGTSQR